MKEDSIDLTVERIKITVEFISKKVDDIITKMDKNFIVRQEFDPYKDNVEEKFHTLSEKVATIEDERVWIKRTISGTAIGLVITALFAILTK